MPKCFSFLIRSLDGLPCFLQFFNRLLPGILSIVGLLNPSWSLAQESTTLSVEPVAGQSLRFGSLLVVQSGTWVLNPQTGVLGGTAQVVQMTSSLGAVGAAEFVITCASPVYPLHYTLALTNASTTTLINNQDLSDFTSFSSLNGNPALSSVRTVNNCLGYSETVKVGATLTLNNNPTYGHFTEPAAVVLQATQVANN